MPTDYTIIIASLAIYLAGMVIGGLLTEWHRQRRNTSRYIDQFNKAARLNTRKGA